MGIHNIEFVYLLLLRLGYIDNIQESEYVFVLQVLHDYDLSENSLGIDLEEK